MICSELLKKIYLVNMQILMQIKYEKMLFFTISLKILHVADIHHHAFTRH